MNDLLEITLGALLRKQAAKYGDKDFIVYSNPDARYPYSVLDKKADSLAKGLLSAGFKRGEHIGIWANNVPEWTTVFFAAARIGLVTVPIHSNYRPKELEYVIAQADIKGLFTINKFRDMDYTEILYQLIPELPNAEAGIVKTDKFPRLKMVANIENTPHKGMYTLGDLISLGNRIADSELEKAESLVSNNDTLCIMYTSGTTGAPKGAMLTHRNIINNGYICNRLGRVTEDAAALCPLPLFHVMCLTNGVVQSLIYGCRVVLMGGFDPLMCLTIIQKEKCDWMYGVPTMFLAILYHPRFSEFSVDSLHYGSLGGAMCLPEMLKAIMEKMQMTDLYIGYGLTETSPLITDTWVSEEHGPVITVGHPLPGIEVSVRGVDKNEECPVNTSGEICSTGHNLMKGYYKMEEATREAIDRNGWFHTGDLGRILPDGRLIVEGRLKEMIIRGGENIYPREVESLIISMPGVKDVQAAAIPSKKYGEEVGVFIILKEFVSMAEKDVIDFCRDKISRYKTPKYVFFVDSYPLTPSGKAQKFKLSELGLKELREKGITP
jgi:fatty-acyl-CoA synthase